MKKILRIIMLIAILSTCIFIGKVEAATPLNSVTLDTTKETVHPGETVTLTINFGTDLGAYTFDIAYDNNLLEYLSAEGGTPSDNGTRVRVTFYDSTGGTSPRTNMSITFKAKEGIITSNPTDLSVTAEGLANADASVQYDDIGVPIVKNIVVEPIFQDYDIELTYTGDVIENVEKEMTLRISSALGKNYEHARIIAEATTPSGGQVTLKGTDEQQLEHDIIQSGWGDASGYEIGGQNVEKVLSLRGLFTKAGAYTIKIILIDRDSSDAEIVSKTFSITALDEQTGENDNTNNGNTVGEMTENTTGEENLPMEEENIIQNEQKENLPQTLPKTGRNIFIPIVVIIIAITSIIAVIKRKNS